MEAFLIIFFIAVGLCAYFLPTIVGTKREIPFDTLLFFINLLVGWTILGWFFCLLWALLATPAPIEKKLRQG